MKKAIICHGVGEDFEYALAQEAPSCAKNFLPWLQQKYLVAGLNCQNPSFPHSWIPDRNYDDDVNVFSRLELDEDTRLIGHSCGCGFLLKYLSEHPEIRIRHLVLVAPWIGAGVPTNKFKYFEDFKLDPKLYERIKQMDLFVSSDDMDIIIQSVEKIKEVYGNKIILHEFKDKGHFSETDMGTREFPELWEVCKSQI
jgi:predicted alpha/beta hydrolase family esterase